MNPSAFIECFVAQMTASSAVIDPRTAVSPNILGVPVVEIDGVFQDFSASGNKIALCAHRDRFNYWWTRGGVQIDVSDSDASDFIKYVLTIRSTLRAVFVATNSKCFTVMSRA